MHYILNGLGKHPNLFKNQIVSPAKEYKKSEDLTQLKSLSVENQNAAASQIWTKP